MGFFNDIAVTLQQAWLPLLSGAGMTIIITVVSLALAMALGFIVCLCYVSRAKPLSWLAHFYIWIFRGTPVIVQAMFIYFALPQALQQMGMAVRIDPFSAGVITLTLNAGAYISEIFRSGIQSVDQGQVEAARSLGLPRSQTMLHIVLPQGIRVCVPSLVNQFIITLKDSSIISIISLPEIVYQAKIYIGTSMKALATWTIVAVFYLVVVTILTKISHVAEKRFSHAKGGS